VRTGRAAIHVILVLQLRNVSYRKLNNLPGTDDRAGEHGKGIHIGVRPKFET
jgi:hypothetical protein